VAGAALDVYKEWLGIPEGPRPPDYYSLLRLIQFEDDVNKIRANYKKLNGHVRKYAAGQHSVRSQELLNELAKAMLCLTDSERKLDYDKSQGREFEEEPSAFGGQRMEVSLVEQEVVTSEQMEEAKAYCENMGLSLRDALIQLKLVDSEVAAQSLAQELGLPFVDLTDLLPDDNVLDRVPKNLVKQNSILPLFIDQDQLLVACADLPSHELVDELRLRFEMPVRAVIATPFQINQGIAKYYAPGLRKEVVDEPRVTAKGKSKDKGTKAKEPDARVEKPKAQPRRGPLTEDEKKQRRQIGSIVMMQSVALPFLLDQFVIGPGKLNLLIDLLIPAVVIPITWLTVFKK
jgi:hypothetical protein